jgi:VIT1/CCC1 family predicted Fe2+/Mn2+ transporter
LLVQSGMPQSPHVEKHFKGGDLVRDVVIGMSDGLTVPFALAAGLSGAVDATSVVVTAGLAEIAAGSIAMGLGGFLAARGDMEHYNSERAREEDEVVHRENDEKQEVKEILEEWGLTPDQSQPVVDALAKNPKAFVDFMMRFELGLEQPDPKRAPRSALTIALSYMVGGFVPLAPYIFVHSAKAALPYSVVVTLVALALFGYLKGRAAGMNGFKSGLQTTLVGGLAAAAAFIIARAIA